MKDIKPITRFTLEKKNREQFFLTWNYNRLKFFTL